MGIGSSEEGNKDDQDSESEIGPDGKPRVKRPKLRGSRCFEVLGLDIMVDKNFKPWLIEVNHLPSFGTDSPLDQDIKERLMDQVFRALPVLSDDESCYLQYHKEQAGKRLTASKKFNTAVASNPPPSEKGKRFADKYKYPGNKSVAVVPKALFLDKIELINLQQNPISAIAISASILADPLRFTR